MNSNVSPPFSASATALRELQAAREVAHAFLTASRPSEVYRIALERVAPLVKAAFGSVFIREDDDLLRVVAVHNWPQAYANYLSEMRVRVGNGPTGRAVAENRVIEVFDVFADPALEDWWDPARELGFASSISLPLAFRGDPIGAITLYFGEPEELCDADRSLLRLVADQLAATAEKAHLIDDLQHANEQLREQNIELEARYRQAEEARRLKNEFLANVSHELRTPLTAILGYSYLLQEEISGSLEGEQKAAVNKIEVAANNLMGLINDLLDLTHLKLGRTTLEPEICDGVALVRAALSALPAPPPGIHLDIQSPGDAVRLYTDPSHVLRILQNLFSNAFKFTPQGAVTIRVRADGAAMEESAAATAVTWEVEDTGIGIAPGDLETIFDEFRQVDGSATRRYGGVGLGLALSRSLARRMGGDITVSSEPENGSTFALTLPALPPRATTPTVASTLETPEPSGS